MALTSLVALAFLVPLAALVQQLAHERALAQAERQSAIVMSVLAVTTDPVAVAAVTTAQDRGRNAVAVHGLTADPIGVSHAGSQDVALASRQQETVVAPVADGLAYLQPIETGEGEVAVVEVHLPEAVLTAGVHRAWWALAGVGAALVLGSAVVGDRLAVRVVRPARRLAAAAGQLGDGDLAVRVPPSGPRELAEAGLAFNQMADRLAALRIAERERVADLSHRLRTPLTGLRLDVEALEAAEEAAVPDPGERLRTVGRVREALGMLEHEIDVLIRTTREAASAASTASPASPESSASPGSPASAASAGPAGSPAAAPGGTAPPGGAPAPDGPAGGAVCDASEVVVERMSFWSAVAVDQDRPCEVSGAHAPAPVPVPASELSAALDALLGNVFRYTPQGAALAVLVSRHDGWVAVRVEDAGPGILDPDRALQRGASDRGSTGLGLDIARRVARAGGGSVSIGTGQLGGASVVMLLADVDAPPPPPPSRRGLIGRLRRPDTGTPGSASLRRGKSALGRD